MSQEAPTEKKSYEKLVDEFLDLDKQVQELVEKFTSGRIIYECVPTEQIADAALFFQKMVEKFVGFQTYLRQLIETRNAKLQEAQIAMRGTVMASQGTRRGADGKATVMNYGPFKVTSKTSRWLDPGTLFEHVQKLGLYQKLLDLKVIDKDSGEQKAAVKYEWSVAYEPVKNWLREQNLETVIDAAYREEEGTPAVTGPAEVAYIGEIQKKKK